MSPAPENTQTATTELNDEPEPKGGQRRRPATGSDDDDDARGSTEADPKRLLSSSSGHSRKSERGGPKKQKMRPPSRSNSTGTSDDDGNDGDGDEQDKSGVATVRSQPSKTKKKMTSSSSSRRLDECADDEASLSSSSKQRKKKSAGSKLSLSNSSKSLSRTKSSKSLSQSKASKSLSRAKFSKSLSQSKASKSLSRAKSSKSLSRAKSSKSLSQSKSSKSLSRAKSSKSLSRAKSTESLSRAKSSKSLSRAKSTKSLSRAKSSKSMSRAKSTKSLSSSCDSVRSTESSRKTKKISGKPKKKKKRASTTDEDSDDTEKDDCSTRSSNLRNRHKASTSSSSSSSSTAKSSKKRQRPPKNDSRRNNMNSQSTLVLQNSYRTRFDVDGPSTREQFRSAGKGDETSTEAASFDNMDPAGMTMEQRVWLGIARILQQAASANDGDSITTGILTSDVLPQEVRQALDAISGHSRIQTKKKIALSSSPLENKKSQSSLSLSSKKKTSMSSSSSSSCSSKRKSRSNYNANTSNDKKGSGDHQEETDRPDSLSYLHPLLPMDPSTRVDDDANADMPSLMSASFSSIQTDAQSEVVVKKVVVQKKSHQPETMKSFLDDVITATVGRSKHEEDDDYEEDLLENQHQADTCIPDDGYKESSVVEEKQEAVDDGEGEEEGYVAGEEDSYAKGEDECYAEGEEESYVEGEEERHVEDNVESNVENDIEDEAGGKGDENDDFASLSHIQSAPNDMPPLMNSSFSSIMTDVQSLISSVMPTIKGRNVVQNESSQEETLKAFMDVMAAKLERAEELGAEQQHQQSPKHNEESLGESDTKSLSYLERANGPPPLMNSSFSSIMTDLQSLASAVNPNGEGKAVIQNEHSQEDILTAFMDIMTATINREKKADLVEQNEVPVDKHKMAPAENHRKQPDKEEKMGLGKKGNGVPVRQANDKSVNKEKQKYNPTDKQNNTPDEKPQGIALLGEDETEDSRVEEFLRDPVSYLNQTKKPVDIQKSMPTDRQRSAQDEKPQGIVLLGEEESEDSLVEEFLRDPVSFINRTKKPAETPKNKPGDKQNNTSDEKPEGTALLGEIENRRLFLRDPVSYLNQMKKPVEIRNIKPTDKQKSTPDEKPQGMALLGEDEIEDSRVEDFLRDSFYYLNQAKKPVETRKSKPTDKQKSTPDEKPQGIALLREYETEDSQVEQFLRDPVPYLNQTRKPVDIQKSKHTDTQASTLVGKQWNTAQLGKDKAEDRAVEKVSQDPVSFARQREKPLEIQKSKSGTRDEKLEDTALLVDDGTVDSSLEEFLKDPMSYLTKLSESLSGDEPAKPSELSKNSSSGRQSSKSIESNEGKQGGGDSKKPQSGVGVRNGQRAREPSGNGKDQKSHKKNKAERDKTSSDGISDSHGEAAGHQPDAAFTHSMPSLAPVGDGFQKWAYYGDPGYEEAAENAFSYEEQSPEDKASCFEDPGLKESPADGDTGFHFEKAYHDEKAESFGCKQAAIPDSRGFEEQASYPITANVGNKKGSEPDRRQESFGYGDAATDEQINDKLGYENAHYRYDDPGYEGAAPGEGSEFSQDSRDENTSLGDRFNNYTSGNASSDEDPFGYDDDDEELVNHGKNFGFMDSGLETHLSAKDLFGHEKASPPTLLPSFDEFSYEDVQPDMRTHSFLTIGDGVLIDQPKVRIVKRLVRKVRKVPKKKKLVSKPLPDKAKHVETKSPVSVPKQAKHVTVDTFSEFGSRYHSSPVKATHSPDATRHKNVSPREEFTNSTVTKLSFTFPSRARISPRKRYESRPTPLAKLKKGVSQIPYFFGKKPTPSTTGLAPLVLGAGRGEAHLYPDFSEDDLASEGALLSKSGFGM